MTTGTPRSLSAVDYRDCVGWGIACIQSIIRSSRIGQKGCRAVVPIEVAARSWAGKWLPVVGRRFIIQQGGEDQAASVHVIG